MIEEFIKGKDKVNLPQDYLFSPAAAASAATAAFSKKTSTPGYRQTRTMRSHHRWRVLPRAN
jgi:hypothetical protein